MARHRNGEKLCPSCAEKLGKAHPKLKEWFMDCVLRHHPDIHIACSERGETEQNFDFKRGASTKPWPMSKHNKKPAEALDLFFLRDEKAYWCDDGGEDYALLDKASQEEGWPILWGGNFPTFKDGPHFELTKGAVNG